MYFVKVEKLNMFKIRYFSDVFYEWKTMQYIPYTIFFICERKRLVYDDNKKSRYIEIKVYR